MGRPVIQGEYVRIGRHRQNGKDLRFRVLSDVLESEAVMKITEEAIIIKRASLDYRGATVKMFLDPCGRYRTTCPRELPEGFIWLSEDSDEDNLIFYLNEITI